MSAYTDRIDAARNRSGNLFRQLMAAASVAAQAIVTESEATPRHAERLAWATRIRAGGVAQLEAFADRVMVHVISLIAVGTDPESLTDTAVQNNFNGILNDWIDRG